jgi:hypothetical protein
MVQIMRSSDHNDTQELSLWLTHSNISQSLP